MSAVGDITARVELYRKDHNFLERWAQCVVAEGWFAVRIDGRAFHTLTEKWCDRPFDDFFELCMDAAAQQVFDAFPNAVLAYVQSDEITVVFSPEFDSYNRRVEKLTSLCASAASVGFNEAWNANSGFVEFSPAYFDARIVECVNAQNLVAMLRERQMDAHRNSLNAVVHYGLVNGGMSARSAHKYLENKSKQERLELLAELGINWSAISEKRKKGRLLRYIEYPKVGWNPVTGEETLVTRRRLEWTDNFNFFDWTEDIL